MQRRNSRKKVARVEKAAKEAAIADSSRVAFDLVFKTYKAACQAYLKDVRVPTFFQDGGKIGETFKEWTADREIVKQLDTARKEAASKIEELKPPTSKDKANKDDKSFVEKAQEKAEDI